MSHHRREEYRLLSYSLPFVIFCISYVYFWYIARISRYYIVKDIYYRLAFCDILQDIQTARYGIRYYIRYARDIVYRRSPHNVFCIATAIQMRYAYRGNNIVYRTVYRNVYLKIYISLSSDIYRENQTLKTPENNMYSRCDISYRTVYRKCILDRMSVCISKYIAHAPSQLSTRSRTRTSNSYSPYGGGGRSGWDWGPVG